MGRLVLLLHPVKRSAQVIPLAVPVVVRSLAQAGAAEIKTQHWQPEALEGFHGVIDHFVVHGSAEERVRVAYHGSVGRILPAKIEQRFDPARRSAQVVHAAQKGSVHGRIVMDLCRLGYPEQR